MMTQKSPILVIRHQMLYKKNIFFIKFNLISLIFIKSDNYKLINEKLFISLKKQFGEKI